LAFRSALYLVAIALVVIIIIGLIIFIRIPGPGPAPLTSPSPGSPISPTTSPAVMYTTTTATAGQAVTSPASPTPARWSVIIATGGVGGVYFYYGGTIANIISNFTDIEATSIQTAASIDNLILIRDKTDLSRGVLYCAAVLPDSAYLAYTGQHERFKDNPAPIAILWAMYPNYLHIVTTTDSGIKTIADLKGKRVSTGAPGSGTEVEALLLLKVAGIDPAKDFSKWEKLGAAESADALRDGAIDAYFWSGGLPTGSVVELARTLSQRGKQIYLVPIDNSTANTFASKYPGLASPGVIPKTVYGAPEDTPTLTFWNMFVCHKNAPADVIYKITKAVFEHLDMLQKAVSAARDTKLENALLYYNGTIPYHEGALRYYQEKGILKR
jgi:TRAP transporter TAXI family solute receptor